MIGALAGVVNKRGERCRALFPIVRPHGVVHGSTTLTLRGAKAQTLRVTTAALRLIAHAAMSASMGSVLVP